MEMVNLSEEGELQSGDGGPPRGGGVGSDGLVLVGVLLKFLNLVDDRHEQKDGEEDDYDKKIVTAGTGTGGAANSSTAAIVGARTGRATRTPK